MDNKWTKTKVLLPLLITFYGIVSFLYTLIRGGEINIDALILTLAFAVLYWEMRSKPK